MGWTARGLIAALSLVVLIPGTFGVSLFDRDEGWYAQVSREMLASGDWLVPTYLGAPWIAKPPLLYWCVAASYALFGVSEWAARLVSVVAMVGVVQLLGTLAASMYDRRVALIAGVVFITAGLPVVVGKMLLTDALLLLWCLGAIVTLWAIARRGATVGRCVAFWACAGLAVLSKGPAVVLFVGAFAVGLVAAGWRRAWLRDARLWLTSPVCIAIAAPWYVYIAVHAGGTLAQQFLWYEVLSRIFGAPHGHTGPPGYYLLASLVGWLPWTALVPGAVLAAWQLRRVDPAARLLLIWCGLPWLVLELITSKLPHYILPCYVPLAIMFGCMWQRGRRELISSPYRGALGIWVGVGLLLGAGVMAAAVCWRVPAAGVAGATLLAGFAFVGWLVRRGRRSTAWSGAVCTIVLFHVLVGLWLLPGLEPYRLSRRVAECVNRAAAADTPVALCGYTEPTVFFYLDRPARVLPPTELAGWLEGAERPYVLAVRERDLATAGIPPPEESPTWHRVRGFNYVKWRAETIWVVHATRE